MQFFDHKPVIIAHRGASAFAPENTIAAFNMAANLKADGIELDVKFTKDRKMVVIHDQTVDRTTNGHGYVKDLLFEDLSKLDAGSIFSAEFKNEKIPQLKNVFDEVAENLLINIEITNYNSIRDGLAANVCSLISNMKMENRVIISSFHPFNLITTKKLLPQVPVALLALPNFIGFLQRSFLFRWLSPGFIHPFYSDVTRKYIDTEHLHNRKVNVWTVNSEQEMKRLNELGCDGIITDNPSLAREVIGIV
jgi:glycerophosphoryl diester phosphodiesterase